MRRGSVRDLQNDLVPTDGVLIRFVGVGGGGGGLGSRTDGRKWLLGRFVTQESMYGTFVRVLFNRIERWVTTKNVCCFSQSHSPFPQRIDLNNSMNA